MGWPHIRTCVSSFVASETTQPWHWSHTKNRLISFGLARTSPYKASYWLLCPSRWNCPINVNTKSSVNYEVRELLQVHLLYIFCHFRFKISTKITYNLRRCDSSENAVCSVVWTDVTFRLPNSTALLWRAMKVSQHADRFRKNTAWVFPEF